MSTAKKTPRAVDNQIAELAAKSSDAATASDVRSNSVINANRLLNSDYALYRGTILDTSPFCYSYKVLLAGGQAPVECCSLQTGGGNATLSFDSSFFAVGTTVLVAVLPHTDIGVILGAIPVAGGASVMTPRTNSVTVSKNAPDDSDLACLSLATKDEPSVGIHNFGVGMPIDTTDIGDFGRMTTTGVHMMLNPFMALMALDDYTGVWMFEADDLLRLSGINLQVRTAGREDDLFNDNGEYIEYRGSVLYPWEQLGYTKKPTSKIIQDTSHEEYTSKESWKAFVEPSEEKAKPFHRITDFGGWLGQGKQTQIVGEPEEPWLKYQNKESLNGLMRLSQTIDGLYSLISATGIAITKRGVLSAVTRVNRVDDTSNEHGDNDSNYESNKFDIKPDIPTATSNPEMERIMGLPDYLAYHQNFKELYPFLQHKKDYFIPEDSELNSGLSRNPELGDLTSKHLLSCKSKKTIKIDDSSSERKEQEVYGLEAGMVDLPDGSKVIYGGNGEEIRMVGGSIFFEAPGDIHIKAGRNIILWSGNDIEERAKNCLDISSSNGSVRLKAEKNLELLGGNDKKSGVIIESRGSGDDFDFSKPGETIKMPGIILKAEESVIASLGGTLYARSSATGTGKGIFIDANNGDHTIYTKCKSNITYLSDEVVYNYANVKVGDVVSTARMDRNSCYIPGSLNVHSSCIIGAGIISTKILLSETVSELHREVRPYIDQFVIKRIDEMFPEAYTKLFHEVIVKDVYEQYKIGYDTILVDAGFSFRTQEQYSLPPDFAVYEAKWQNICNSLGVGSNWEEPVVLANGSGEATMPYPGKDFYEQPRFITQALTLIDTDTGLFKDRWSEDKPSEPYSTPKYGEQTKKTLFEYKTIK